MNPQDITNSAISLRDQICRIMESLSRQGVDMPQPEREAFIHGKSHLEAMSDIAEASLISISVSTRVMTVAVNQAEAFVHSFEEVTDE